ncbi:MAG: hypothetical protein RIC95_14070 [Vicingaceae bacterium]
MPSIKTLNDRVDALNYSVEELILFFKQQINFQQYVYPKWTMKDVLGHLTFWHESFASNVEDLYHERKPCPLSGKLSEVNKRSVESNRNTSISTLIKRLKTAQNSLKKHIHCKHIDMIPYKKGSRDYSKEEHLELVQHHIQKHLKDLKTAV